MRALKRTVSVLLSLMLVLGMVAMGAGTVSAAETNTITVSSNIASTVTQTYTPGVSEQVTVTYAMKVNQPVVEGQGVVTFDKNVLKVASGNTATTFYADLTGGAKVVNLEKTDGRIPFNFSNTASYDMTANTKFVSVVFDIIGTGDTTVNLNMEVLTVTKGDPTKLADDVVVIDDDVNDTTAYTAATEGKVTPEQSLADFSNFLYRYRTYLDGKVSLSYVFYKNPRGGFDPSTLSVRFSGPAELTDQNKTVAYSSIPVSSNALNRYEYQMYSAMFSQPVTCEILQNGQVIAKDTYSIEQYVIDNIGSANDKLATLYKTLLNFGAKAQTQFNKFTDAPADRNIDYTMQQITADDITLPAGVGEKPDLTDIGLKFYKESGAYLAATDLKVIYQVKDKTLFANASATLDGEALPFTNYNTSGTAQQLTIDTIASPLLDKAFEITFNNGKVYKTSILAQVKTKLAEDPTNQFYMAVYWYNQAANAYFNK